MVAALACAVVVSSCSSAGGTSSGASMRHKVASRPIPGVCVTYSRCLVGGARRGQHRSECACGIARTLARYTSPVSPIRVAPAKAILGRRWVWWSLAIVAVINCLLFVSSCSQSAARSAHVGVNRSSESQIVRNDQQDCLNEFMWRYNHRYDRQAMFETLVLRACEG
jgi:hypothetical protein